MQNHRDTIRIEKKVLNQKILAMRGIMNRTMQINFASLTKLTTEQHNRLKETIKQYKMISNMDKAENEEKSKFDMIIEELWDELDFKSISNFDLSFSQIEELLEIVSKIHLYL